MEHDLNTKKPFYFNKFYAENKSEANDMRRSFSLLQAIFWFLFLLTSCENNQEKGLLPSETPKMGTGTSSIVSAPQEEIDTAVPATQIGITAEPMSAKGTVETYYELMGAQEYAKAYRMVSALMPHRKTLQEFTSEAETFYKSYELLSIESLPVWVSTAFANNPTRNKPIIEDDRCKRFVVEIKVEYKEGVMGAGPSGTYTFSLTVIKNEDGWKIVQIDTLPAPSVCEDYR